jgi:hypothetical protein
MEVINLTPHALNVYLSHQAVREGQAVSATEGTKPALTIPSTGFARAKEIVEQLAPLNLGDIELPVNRKAYAPIVDGLPEAQEDTIYVVSFLTAQAVPDREDVFFPGDAVRDAAGKIMGCVGLSRV